MSQSFSSLTRILAVDNDAEVLSTIGRALEREGYQTITAKDGLTALRLAREYRPALIILDIMMPGMNGFELCAQLRRMPLVEDTPILFLSVHMEADHVARALDSGGDDYLRKPFVARELMARVRALLRRTVRKSSQTGPTLALNPKTHVVMLDGTPVTLTPTEYDLLNYLSRHQAQHHTAETLLQVLWNYPPGTGDTALVRNHIRNLRRKIEQDPERPEIIVSLHGRGYAVHARIAYTDAAVPVTPISQ